jgi:hypothetical protein
MIRWLSRYVKRIDVFGVGVELREIPADEAEKLRTTQAGPAPERSAADHPVVRREEYLCLSGTSASAQRTPRELDLMADGEEIQLHVHPPGGSQPRMWVGRPALEQAFAEWRPTGEAGGTITVPARTARKEAQVAFVFDDSGEVEVQAGWWIWVGKQDLTAALAELGVRAPW